MMKIVQLPLIIALSFLAVACTSDEDDELLEIEYSEEEFPDGVVDPSSRYAFTLSDDGVTNIVLKGEIGEITIAGSLNWIVIEEDTYIERLTILGDTNMIEEDGLNVTIEVVKIVGDGNAIYVSECIEWSATGEGNAAPIALNCDTSEL